jgi:hypothetical protein
MADSPFIGPARPLPCLSSRPVFPSASTPSAEVPVISLLTLLVVVVRADPARDEGFLTGSSKGRLIIDRSESERLKSDEVYERN